MRKLLPLLFLFSSTVVLSYTDSTFYSQGGGNWSSVTWQTATGTAMQAGDDTNGQNNFVISDGHNVDLNQDISVSNLTIGEGTNGRLRMGNDGTTRTATISGDVLIASGATFDSRNSDGIHEIVFSGTSFTNNGNMGNLHRSSARHTNITVNSSGFTLFSGTVNLEFGDFTIDGQGANGAFQSVFRIIVREDITVQNTAQVSTSARWDMYGSDFTLNTGCSWTSTQQLIYFSGDQNLTFDAEPQFNDLYLDNGTKTIDGNFTVDDFCYVYNDAIVNNVSSGTYTLNDELRIDGGGQFNLTGNLNFTATFDGNSYLRSNGGATIAFSGLDINILGNTTLRSGDSFTISNGDLKITGGYLNLNAGSLEHSVGANTDTLFLAAQSLYIRGSDNFPDNFNVYDINANSWIRYDGNLIQTVRSNSTLSYGNMYLGFSTKNADGDLDINGRLQLGNSCTFNMGSFDHTIGGDNILGAGVINSTGSVTLDAENFNQTFRAGISYNFNDLVLDLLAPTGTRVKTIQTNLTVNGDLTLKNTGGNSSSILFVNLSAFEITNNGTGTFSMEANTLLNTGAEDNFENLVGSFNSTSLDCNSTIRFSGNTDANLPGNGAPLSFNGQYGNIEFNMNGNASPLAELDICGFVDRVGSNVQFSDQGFSHTVGGNWSMAQAYTDNMTGTITFDGTNQTISASDFFNVVFANGGTKTLQGDIIVGGDFSVNTGVTVSTNDMVNLAGNITVSGTGLFKQSLEDFILDGTADQNISISTPTTSHFEDLTINKASGTVNAITGFTVLENMNFTANNANFDLNGQTIFVGRNWDLNTGCTFTHNNGTVHFNGTVDQDLFNDLGATYFNLVFTGAGEKRFLGQDWDIDGDVTFTSTTIDQNSRNLTVAGDWNNVGGTYQGFARTSFDGTNQNIDASDFHDFYTANSGTKSLDGTIKCTGVLYIENNTILDANGFEISVEEQWFNDNGGTFTHNNNKVVFIGGANNIYTGGTGPGFEFYDLEINLQSTINNIDIEGNDIDIENDFTITQGVVRTQNNNIHLEGSLTIDGELNMNNGTDTVYFDGTSGSHTVKSSAASTLRNVIVNASGATYSLISDFTMLSNRPFILQAGTWDLNGRTMTLSNGGGDLTVNGGTFEIDEGAILRLGNGGDILNAGGNFNLIGTSGTPATISATGGTFSFDQTSGTLNAIYYVINAIDGPGLDIQGGTIDATNNLSYGTFSGGTGTAYMDIASGSFAATATIVGCVFNDNSGTPTYNCRHNAGQQLIFESASGTRGGYIYEDDELTADPSNGLIQWTYPGGILWVGTTGGGDGISWEDGNNWDAGSPPTSGQVAIVDHTTVAAAINIDIDASIAQCSQLTLDDQGGNPISLTLNGQELEIGSDGLSVGSNCTLTQTQNGDTISISGDWSNAGTFNENGATVVFNDTIGTTTITTGGSGDSFNDIIFRSKGVVNNATFSLANDLDVNGDFSLDGGTFDVVSSANSVTIGGDWSVTSGDINPRNGTITFDQTGTSTQNISGGVFYNFTTDNSGGGTNTKLLGSNIVIQNDLTIGTNTILNGQTSTIFVGGDWNNLEGTSGFTQTGAGSVIFNGSTFTQDIGRSAQPTTFLNMYIQGTDNKNITADINLSNDLYIISGIGTVTVTANVSIDGVGGDNDFIMTGGNLRLLGTDDFPSNFENINLSGGQVQYRGDVDQNIFGTEYYNLQLRAATGVATTKTASGNFTVNNNLDLNDDLVTTLDVNNFIFTLNGSWTHGTGSPQPLWGTAGGTGTFIHDGAYINFDADLTNFNNVVMAGSSTKDINSDWLIAGDFTVNSGVVFDMNTQTVMSTQSGKTFSIAGGGQLRTQTAAPDTAFPTGFDTYTIDASSMVNLNRNGAQNIYTSGGNIAYGNLDLNGGGNKTILDGTLDVDGEFDQNAGTLIDNNNDINFAGDVYRISHTPSVGTTITYDGDDQEINSTNGGDETLQFYNVVFTGSGTKSILNDRINVDGDLTVDNNITVDQNDNGFYAGNFTNNGTFDASAGTHTFDGTGNQTIDPGANHDFNSLSFDNGSPNIKTVTGNGFDVGNGDFSVTGDAIANFADLTHTIASQNFNISGTWDTDSANLTFDRLGTQNVPELTAAQDIVCSGSGTKILQGDWSIDDLTIDPTITLDANNGNDFTITLTGNWLNSGTFADRNGTVEFESNDNTSKVIQTNGSQFYEVMFNQSQTNTRTYSLSDDMSTNENITIGSGATLGLNGNLLLVGNNDSGNPSGEQVQVDAGATLEVDADAILQFNANDTGGDPLLNVDGTFRIVGTPSNFATLTRQTGNMYIEATINGTLEARYYQMQYLNDDGLNITSSATIHSTNNLSDGSFSNIRTNVGATYLTVEADVTGLDSIRNVTFNHGGTPSIGNDFNVTRTRADGGILNFANASNGLLAGEDYDNDPNGDTRITWPVKTITTWTAGAGTSDWFTAGNWDNGVPNTSLDAVVPLVGPNPIIDGANATAKSLTVTNGFLRLDNGFDLSVSGDVVLGSTGAGVITVLNNTSDITVGGSWTVVNAAAVFTHGDATVIFNNSTSASVTMRLQQFGNVTFQGNGTYNVIGDLTVNGNVSLVAGTVVPSTNNYDFFVAGDWNVTAGTFSTVTNGTVTLNGTGAQAVTAGYFDNLLVAGSGTKTFNGACTIIDDLDIQSDLVCAASSALDIDGDMTIETGGSFDDGGETHTFAGQAWTQDGSFVTNAGAGNIQFDRTSGVQRIGAASFNNLELNGNSQFQLDGNISIQTNFIMRNSINFVFTNAFGISNATGTGTFSLEAAERIYCEGLNSYPSNFSTYNVDATSFAFFSGGADQNIQGGANVVYGNIVVSTANTKTLTGNIDVNGYLDFNDGTIDANNFDISLAGHWYNQDLGSFTPGTGTVTFDGTLDPQFIFGGIPANGSKALGKVTVNKSNLAELSLAGENLTIGGDFYIDAGTFDQNGLITTYQGNFVIDASSTAFIVTGTSVFDGSGTHTLTMGGKTLNNVEFSSSGGVIYNLTDNMDVNGNFEIGTGTTFNGSGNEVILGNYLNTVQIDGTYSVGTGGTLRLAQLSSVNVGSSGTFIAVGTAGNSATITREVTNNYNFTIDGTLRAQYYEFSYMGTGGITINSGGTIHSTDNLSNGVFNYPAVGGTCLRIENNQSFTGANRIENVSFPFNPGGGAFNVTKSSSVTGTINFHQATGVFSGETYDNDPSDLIDWTGELELTWNGSVSSDWYDADNWTPSFGSAVAPDSAIDVLIPFTVRQPIITTNGAKANNVNIGLGAILTLNTSDTGTPDLRIFSDLEQNGLFQFIGSEDSITIAGNWTRTATGSINMADGQIALISSGSNPVLTVGKSGDLPELHCNVAGNLTMGDEIKVKSIFINTGALLPSTNNYEIEVKENFINSASFNTVASNVLFSGTTGGNIDIGSSSFYDIEIDAPGATYNRISNDLRVLDNITIEDGTLSSNSGNIVVGNGVTDDGININGGTLSIDAGGELQIASNAQVAVNSGGTVRVVGNDTVNIASVTSISGRYFFNIRSGGTIQARFYEFANYAGSGIYVQPGATIDPAFNFSYGTFSNPASSGTMLRIENNQTLTSANRIEYVRFSLDGASNVTNVRKTITSTGDLSFYWPLGDHRGEEYENDAFDLIHWDADLFWTGGTSDDWHDPDNWDNDLAIVPNTWIPSLFSDVIFPTGVLPNECILDGTDGLANDIDVLTGRTFTIDGGTSLTTTDTVRINGGSLVVTAGSGNTNLNIGGTWDASAGTFTPGTNTTVTMTALGSDTCSVNNGANTFCNFAINCDEPATDLIQTASALDINCNMNITQGTFEVTNAAHTINLAQNWSNGNASGGFNGGDGTVIFDGGTLQTITHTGGLETFGDVQISNAAGLQANDAISTDDFTIDDGTFFDANSNNNTVRGNWNNNNTVANVGLSNPAITIFAGTATQNINHAGSAETFGGLTNNNTSANLEVNVPLTVRGNITIADNAVIDANSNNISARGDWNNNNTSAGAGFANANLVVFNGGSSQSISHAGGREDFNTIQISNTTSFVQLNNSIATSGNITIDNSADFRANANDITAGANWINNHTTSNGGFNPGTGTVIFNGGVLQTISHAGGSQDFHHLQNSNTSANLQSNVDLDLSGNLILDNSTTLTPSNNNINIAGNWTNNNAVASAGWIPGTSDVTFNGTSLQTISHAGGLEVFNNLRISNTSNNVQMNTSIDLAGNITIFNNAVLDANGNNINIAGNWDNNETSANTGFIPGAGTVTFDGSGGAQTINQIGDSERFNNIRFSNTSGDVDLIGGTELDINGNVTIDNGAFFDPNGGDITLAGNWTNNTTTSGTGFRTAGSVITIDGNGQQQLTHAGDKEIWESLIVDNSAIGTTSLFLNDTLEISNSLQFIDGVIETFNALLWITNSNGGALTGNSGIGYVFGKLRRNIATNTHTYDFPMGVGNSTAEYYNAMIINNNLTGTSWIQTGAKVLTESGNNVDGNLSLSEGGTHYTNLREDCEWDIIPDVQPSGGTYGVRLFIANIPGLVDDQFAPLKRDDSSTDYADWSNGSSTTIPVEGAAGRTVASGYAERLGYTSFSLHAIAETNAALPIELITFTGESSENGVVLSWATAMEINNDYFTLERSFDNKTFETIAIIKGSGNTYDVTEYEFLDENTTKSGLRYYKLRQTDYDGTSKTFNTIAIDLSSDEEIIITPNPANDQIFVSVNKTGHSDAVLEIYNAHGHRVYVDAQFHNSQQVDVSHLPNGIYSVKIKQSTGTVSSKLLISK